MPVIIAYGMPDRADQAILQKLCAGLINAVVSVSELHLSSDQVSVFFPSDRLKVGLGDEIIIFVEGLFIASERTSEVKKSLAFAIVAETRQILPFCIRTIECFVRSFNQEEEGFESR